MQQTKIMFRTALVLLILTLSAPIAAQKQATREEKEKAANLPAVIWRDPGDIATLNLLYGAGGKEHAPDPNAEYTFLQEEMGGHNPKFDIEDEHGERWRVKVGEEVRSETAATRLLWAAGYFVDEDYYLAEVKVMGLPKLRRGRKWASADGTVRQARLERRLKGVKKLEDWSWFKNPFIGTKEFNGLRVMMALLNNWDLKPPNNSVYRVGDERRYLVSDVGATFGKTGGYTLAHSKGVLKDYADSEFIDKVTGDEVNLVMHSRPFFMTVFAPPVYQSINQRSQIAKHIPRADAKWIGQRLSQLSEEQIRDCFRAVGYTSEEVEGYTSVVRKRIAELTAL